MIKRKWNGRDSSRMTHEKKKKERKKEKKKLLENVEFGACTSHFSFPPCWMEPFLR